jgi:hypothetical protein
MASPGARLVAVYDDEQSAQRATRALVNAGMRPADITVDDSRDHLASVGGEMRSEFDHTIAGPGAVGPWTKEMTKGMLLGTVLGGLIGVVLAVPFAAIPFGDLEWWARLVIVMAVGGAVGATTGWFLGGAFGAKRPQEPLAAEEGVTVAAPATLAARRALLATHPVRLDLVEANNQPVDTLAERDQHVVRDLGRHMAAEDREN